MSLKILANEFIYQYKSNEEMAHTWKHLEMAKHRENESFSDFVIRWMELAAKMVYRLKEDEYWT